jgi:uncharacterized protein YecE (DUF72 family)
MNLLEGLPRNVYIGTSGWNYGDWRRDFYAGVPPQRWLSIYAERFNAVEANGTFYRQQQTRTYARWKSETPENFRFTIKAHRFLTHNKKLLFPPESLTAQKKQAAGLGDKLAVVVWQLPRALKRDEARLMRFAETLKEWPEARHTVEFRHSSWFTQEVANHLARYQLAACQSDSADWPLWDAVTTDLVYIRLHGHTQTYASSYSDAELDAWADRIRNWVAQDRQVHLYFDNTGQGHAPKNALRLVELLAG